MRIYQSMFGVKSLSLTKRRKISDDSYVRTLSVRSEEGTFELSLFGDTSGNIFLNDEEFEDSMKEFENELKIKK